MCIVSHDAICFASTKEAYHMCMEGSAEVSHDAICFASTTKALREKMKACLECKEK
jgi:hypothetical protein